jgi:integrase
MAGRRDYGGGSLEERSPGRWRLTIALAPDPLTGGRRRHRFAVQGTKKEAQAALRQALSERDTGGVDPSRVTTGDWLSRWLERHVDDAQVSPRVADNYRAILRARVVPAVGNVRLQELRAEHIQALKDELARDLAPATIRKALGLVKQGLQAAVVGELITRNPASPVQSPSVAAATVERRALNEDEIAELLRAAHGTRYDVPIRFSLATGIRQAELLGLPWEAVDLDRGSFEIRQTLAQTRDGFAMRPPKTKNSRRTIELSDQTVALLRRHRSTQLEERLQLGSVWRDQGLAFPGETGGPQYRQSFYRAFRRVVLEKTEIESPESVNWHSLRHTAASLWLRAGVDIFTVSRRLGHASASFTMDQYGHLLAGQQRAAAEALDHLLG